MQTSSALTSGQARLLKEAAFREYLSIAERKLGSRDVASLKAVNIKTLSDVDLDVVLNEVRMFAHMPD